MTTSDGRAGGLAQARSVRGYVEIPFATATGRPFQTSFSVTKNSVSLKVFENGTGVGDCSIPAFQHGYWPTQRAFVQGIFNNILLTLGTQHTD